MTVRPIARARATVSSRLPSSTRRISSTLPGGTSAMVAASVLAALYAGKTAMILCVRRGGVTGARMSRTWTGACEGFSGGRSSKTSGMATSEGECRRQCTVGAAANHHVS